MHPCAIIKHLISRISNNFGFATLSKGYTFGATEEVTAAKLSSLVDSASITGITGSEISSNTVADTNIISISGAKFTSLANIPAGAGQIPAANMSAMIPVTYLDTDGTLTGNSDTKLATQKATKTYADGKISKTTAGEINALTEKTSTVAADLILIEDSAASYAKKKVQKSNLFSGLTLSVFTSDGTFTAPSGVTRVYITMCGGGGGGADRADASNAGGGGGGGASLILSPHTVVPASGYAVTVGAAGTAGSASNGGDGGDTSFDTLTVKGGSGGVRATGVGGAGGVNSINASGTTAGIPGWAGGSGGTKSTSTSGGGGASMLGTGGTGVASGAVSAGKGYGWGGAGGPGDGSLASVGGAGIVIVAY